MSNINDSEDEGRDGFTIQNIILCAKIANAFVTPIRNNKINSLSITSRSHTNL